METNWLLESLIEKTGMSSEKINSLISKKLSEFPTLTEDAALRMIATENGVMPVRRTYKLGELSEESNHLNITANIKRKFEPRKINIKGTPSKVINLLIEDHTGKINVVVWDVKKVDYLIENASEGDEISIANAYSKRNKLNGSLELHIGNGSAIKINKSATNKPEEKIAFQRIGDVKDDTKMYNIKCFITRVFTNNVFLVKCDICKKRVTDKCEEHGDKALSKMLFISCVVDDGLSSIKASFFDRTAKKLLDISKAESLETKLNDLSFGMYEMEIKALPNKFNDALSLNVRDVKELNYSF